MLGCFLQSEHCKELVSVVDPEGCDPALINQINAFMSERLKNCILIWTVDIITLYVGVWFIFICYFNM